MLILEAVLCGEVELYYIILRGVSNIQSTLTDINVVDRKNINKNINPPKGTVSTKN